MGATVVVGIVLVAGVVNLSLRKHVTLVVDGRAPDRVDDVELRSRTC